MDEEEFGFDAETDIEDAIEALMGSDPDETLLSDDTPDDESDDEPDVSDDDVEDEEEDDTDVDDEQDDEDPDAEADEDDKDDNEDETDDEEGEEAPEVASDDAEVEITVGEEVHRVSVKDLKRLHGQEASLTQKSQSLANQRRAVEEQGLYVANILKTRYDAAVAKAAQFADIDLFKASRELDDAEFDALRSAKEGAESEVAALEREGQQFLTNARETRSKVLKEHAQVALKEIVERIPDWNDELYTSIRTYAVKSGVSVTDANEMIDPATVEAFNKARLYDELQSAKGKVKQKITKTSKKVAKKGTKPTRNNTSKLQAAKRDVFTSEGDVDAVTELFMQSMSEE